MSTPGGFKYFVGIVGNPSVPDIGWSDEELEQIKALGVNMVQLNIAWGGKPAGEVLNLEDLDADQRAKFVFRIKQAQKHGLNPFPGTLGLSVPRALPAPASAIAEPRREARCVRSMLPAPVDARGYAGDALIGARGVVYCLGHRPFGPDWSSPGEWWNGIHGGLKRNHVPHR